MNSPGVNRVSQQQIEKRKQIFNNIDKNEFCWQKKVKTVSEDENLLSPFYVEEDGESQLYEISSTYQQGYKAISILIDSGASDSVAPPGYFDKITVLENGVTVITER